MKHLFFVVLLGCSFIAGYLVSQHREAEFQRMKDYDVVVDVYNPWGGPKFEWDEVRGEVTGQLFIKIKDGKEEYVYFIHKGDTCKYVGQFAWDAVGSAVRGKGPMFQFKVQP
jgi:hypothetical protein